MARVLGTSYGWFIDEAIDVGPWMANLDDSIVRTDIFVPGTHDCLARYGGNVAQCQWWSIEE